MANASQLQKKLVEFERVTGRGIEEGIKELGAASARALAINVQPFGIKSNDRFLRSIRAQVERAWFGVNVGAFPATNDMRQAHYQARKDGVVPPRLFRRQRGNPWLGLIPEPERDRHADAQVKKAGRAKAAWLEAGNSLGRKSFGKRGGLMKISGAAQWIRRHMTSGWGTSSIIGTGLKAKIELHNRTPYMSNIQTSTEISKALREGRQRGLGRLKSIIRGELKKIK